jgi:chemotaxis protein methyltransferase CheR
LSPVAPAQDYDQLMQTAWRDADGGMPAKAEENCRKAIAVAAFDPRPHFLLAQLAQERGDPIQAKTSLKKVIYLDPSFIAAYLELGAVYAQAGENDRARRMYESAGKALKKLPPQATVAPYSESTAAEILAYVHRLLGGPAGAAVVSSAKQPRTRQSE